MRPLVLGEVSPFELSFFGSSLLPLLLLLPLLFESVSLTVGCYTSKNLNNSGCSGDTNRAILASTIVATSSPRDTVVVRTMYVVVVQQSGFGEDGESGEKNEC